MTTDKDPYRSGVVVIGAGPGVGAGVARAFAREGHPVALVARNRGTLEQLADTLRGSGATVTTAVGDAACSPCLLSALQGLELAVPVGVLVYNAAGFGGPLLQTDPDTLRRASEVNLHSLVGAVQALLPQLQQTSGTVLVTGGGLAMYPVPAVGVLSVGKATVRAAALVLAQELEPVGVAVRTVTITGTVEPGGPFDPDRIAQVYLALHRRDVAGPEVMFTGTPQPGA